jgi:hypothetical protein
MGWTCFSGKEDRKAYSILMGKPEGKAQLKDQEGNRKVH